MKAKELAEELHERGEVVVELQLTIEALALLLVLKVLHYPVRVGDTIRCIVVTRGIERIAQILHLCDTDIARSLHDGVVHRATALTCGHEAVLLVGVVYICTDGYSLHLLAGIGREGVLGVAVSIGRNDTVIVNLRQADIEGGQVCGIAERYAVVVAETGIEEILGVVLDRQVRLHVL